MSIPFLGVGLGYRTHFDAEINQLSADVDWYEINAEDFWRQVVPNPVLSRLGRTKPLVPHGALLSVGSADGIQEGVISKLVRFLSANPNFPYYSDHLCFTHVGGRETSILGPIPFTPEALETVARNIAYAARSLPTPLIFENITYYASVPASSMAELEFWQQLFTRVDCGMLLDLTNLFVNASNHGYDPVRFLEGLPAGRITQLHLGGARVENGIWYDSHDCPIPEQVWELMEHTCRICRPRGVLLERDDHLERPGEAEAVAAELRRARAVLSGVNT